MLKKKKACRISFFPPLLLFLLTSCQAPSQEIPDHPDQKRNNKGVRAVFYNLENFFYPKESSTRSHDPYTPDGKYHWSWYRYHEKKRKIAQTLLATGGWELPGIIGVSEVENKKVLGDLIQAAPLKNGEYRVIHEDSPDHRGIDVGLLYRPEKFKVLYHKAITVDLPFEGSKGTRDILQVKGKVHGKATLHLFINHWPSRWGGTLKTQRKRLFVAKLLKNRVDSIFRSNPHASVLIMGDLNDNPTNKSLKVLAGETLEISMANIQRDKGTHKYQDQWSILDHFLFSDFMDEKGKRGSLFITGPYIFDAEWLLKKEKGIPGQEPYRTFTGPSYKGGYSDHLPIFLDLWIRPSSR